MLHAGLHGRGGRAGAGVSVMVLWSAPSSLNFSVHLAQQREEARVPSPPSAGSRESPSALPKGRAKGAQALALLLCPQDGTWQKRISCCRAQDLEKMLQEEQEATLGTAFCRVVTQH